jgi:hypothetical protein
MNNVFRRKEKCRGNSCFSYRAANARLDLWYCFAGIKKLWSGCGMNCAVNTSAAEHPFVCSINDGIDFNARDVAEQELEGGHYEG